MSRNRVFRFARITDRQLLQLFQSLQETFPDGGANFRLGHGLNANHVEVTEIDFPRNSHAIDSANWGSSAAAVDVQFARGVSQGNFNERIPSSLYDEIQVAVNQNSTRPSIDTYLNILQTIESATLGASSIESEEEELSLTGILDAELRKLSELATELTVGADQKRRELDSLRDELQASFDARVKDFEVQKNIELEDLSQKKHELEEAKRKLDDREHKHVRRQLRESITEAASELSRGPSSSGRAGILNIVSICLALIAAAATGYLAYYTQINIDAIAIEASYNDEGILIAQQPSSSLPVYILYLKLFLSGAASLSFVILSISWLRSFANDDTEHRRKLEKFSFDMNRASWTIETILELSESELQEIPQSWLDSVCSGLFTEQGQPAGDESSLRALAALLNVTTEAEIGPEGPKFRLNRRAARRAASQIGED